MCMQSMSLIWPRMWSGGVLTHNTTREVEIYSNQPKRNIAKLFKNKGQSDLILCWYVNEP